ncbi:hypothetical protein GCM10010446_33080 [Streptomyces enissocaesilis]|uniref:Uncharacterized protein n=1 Tax=Streptomyces enissocaesilis TaxID=332589 RepID=A0ABP6JS82_9ACTN
MPSRGDTGTTSGLRGGPRACIRVRGPPSQALMIAIRSAETFETLEDRWLYGTT